MFASFSVETYAYQWSTGMRKLPGELTRLKGSLMYPTEPPAVSMRPTQVVPERGMPVTRIGGSSPDRTLEASAAGRGVRFLRVKSRCRKKRRTLVLPSTLWILARQGELLRRFPRRLRQPPARGEVRAATVPAAR